MVYKIGWRNRVGGYNTPRVGDVQPRHLFSRITEQPPFSKGFVAHYAARLESFADGDAVGTFTDQTGTGNDLTQSTSSQKPTFKTGIIGGQPVLRFDGSDDRMTLDGPIYDQPNTFYAIAETDNPTKDGNARVYTGSNDTTGDKNSLFVGNNSRGDEWEINNIKSGITPNAGQFYLISARYDGASGKIRVDQAETTGDTGTTSHEMMHMGMDDGEAFSTTLWNGDIAEVLVYNVGHTDTEMVEMEEWLNDIYGIL